MTGLPELEQGHEHMFVDGSGGTQDDLPGLGVAGHDLSIRVERMGCSKHSVCENRSAIALPRASARSA